MHVVKSYDYPFNFCSCLLQPDQITLGIMDGNVALIVNAGLSDIIMKTSEDYNDGEWHFATVKQERSKWVLKDSLIFRFWDQAKSLLDNEYDFDSDALMLAVKRGVPVGVGSRSTVAAPGYWTTSMSESVSAISLQVHEVLQGNEYSLDADFSWNNWGAFLLTNLNLDSSIETWIRLLTSWDIKSESGSVFTRMSLGRGYLETFGQRFM